MTVSLLKSDGTVWNSAIARGLARSATFLLAFRLDNFWFQAETNRAKDEVQLRRRLDSEDKIWPIGLAKEQLASVTEHGFHGIFVRVEL
jgi:hypothetical protein